MASTALRAKTRTRRVHVMERLVTLAASLACGAALGCTVPTGPTDLPALPGIDAVTLFQGGQATDFGWEGQPGAVRIVGRNLRDPDAPDAPLLGTATRVADRYGRVVQGPEVSAEVTLTGGAASAEGVLDLPGDTMRPGTWRVTLADRRGLVASAEEAFRVAPVPQVVGLDQTALCQAPPYRLLTLRGFNLASDVVSPALVAPDGEIPLGVASAWSCTCGSTPTPCLCLELRLPDLPLAGAGEVVLRYPGTVAPLPAGRLVYESPGRPTYQGPLAALDGPVEALIWSGTPVHFGPGAATSAHIGDLPLALRGEGCASTGFPGVERCSAIWATIPQGFPTGSHAIDVTSEAGCSFSVPVTLVERPVLSGLSPPFICQRAYSRLTLLGSGLYFTRALYSPGGTGPWLPFDPGNPSSLPFGSYLVVAETLGVTPPVRSATQSLAVFPGPMLVSDRPAPALVYSEGARPVSVWVSAATGRITGRLVVLSGTDPLFGTDPVPVELTSAGDVQTFTFPALGGNRSYYVEFSDESPCGAARTGYWLETRNDPVLMDWDFDLSGQPPTAYTAAGMATADPVAAITPDAGVIGSAATGRSSADVGDWYLGWWPNVPAGDLGLIRFELKASGSGAPSTAPGLFIKVADAYDRYHDLRTQLTPPAPGAWTHYEVRLDDPSIWTVTEPTGESRAATSADLQSRIQLVEILGSWWAGPGDVAVDDLAIELAR